MHLLDTNVLSELVRPEPDQSVLRWVDGLPGAELWTCSVVIAELLSGIERMPDGKKSRGLRAEVEEMITFDFRGQILLFDVEAARRYSQILAARSKMGRPIHEMDAQIAAIAAVHGAKLVTRNVRDFDHCGIKVVNPWEAR
jgi:toxin FitB